MPSAVGTTLKQDLPFALNRTKAIQAPYIEQQVAQNVSQSFQERMEISMPDYMLLISGKAASRCPAAMALCKELLGE